LDQVAELIAQRLWN